MPYPSRRDFDDRFHVVRRRDAFHCLEAAAEYRRAGLRSACNGIAPAAFLFNAAQTLKNARRYNGEARTFGMRLPGEPEPFADLADLPSPSALDLAAEAAAYGRAAYSCRPSLPSSP